MSHVSYTFDGAVAVITLDRPPVNALSADLTADLEEAVGRAEDPAVRAVVVTGRPHFAAGADIGGFREAMDTGSRDALATHLSEVFRRLERLPKPVIAAVRGFALGGGLELAMACDFRFFAEDATVGQPEIKLGLIPGAGGTQRLPRLVGTAKARDLIYTGRQVTAEEALAMGLADRVIAADALDDEAMAFATELASGPTRAIGAAKRVINSGLDVGIDQGLAQEADAFEEAFATDDAREGVAAFLEKRRPSFGGR